MKKFIVSLAFVSCTIGTLFSTQNWSVTYTGQPNTLRGICFLNDNIGFVVGDHVFLKTTNGGNNWLSNLNRLNLQSVYFLNNQTGFVAGNSNDSGFILKTTDNGSNWSNFYLSEYPLAHDYGNIFFKDNNTGYLVQPYKGYYRTTNGGLFWVFKDYPYGRIQDFKWIGNLFYKIGSSGSGYQKATYWTSSDETNWGAPYYCDECDNNEYGISVSIYDTVSYLVTEQNGNKYVRRKSNSNQVWQTIGSGGNVFAYYFVNKTSFHFGHLYNSKTYLHSTSNAGYTWINDTLPDFTIRNMFFVNQSTGYAVGENGLIAKTTNGGGAIGIQTLSTEVPGQYLLSQNYPNPFNPKTNIEFDIVKNGYVKVTVFDVLGEEITILVDQELQVGSYQVDWIATNYPSGIYFYRLDAKDFTMTKKMVLSK